MTEVMESVTVNVVLEPMYACPFPHEKADFPNPDNNFLGDGDVLGENMEKPFQTAVLTEHQASGVVAVMRPSRESGSALYRVARPIRLGGYDPETLPLTCAAHHLIPAQASLRSAQSLAVYLFKDTAKFYQSVVVDKGSKKKRKQAVDVSGGKLTHNVGYDVNGIQNGVWLPGPYALRAREVVADVFGEKAAKKKRRPSVVDRMRTQTRPDDDALDGEDFVENPDGETGAEPEREPFDYYFLYTVAAMQKVGTQYHDGHTEYSKFVREALERLSVLLYMIDVHLTCTKCRDTRPPGDKLWPPYELLRWLNSLSGRLKGFLVGPPAAWRLPLYTSGMSLQYWKHRNEEALKLYRIEAEDDDE